MEAALTDRQRRELEYHRGHAAERQDILAKPLDFSCVFATKRRWWNAYWEMYSLLKAFPEAGRRVLIVGCGFGDDAVRVAKFGGEVHAFDLSPESLEIARELAARNGAKVEYRELAAERLDYRDAYFDCIVIRDILHHVDIRATLKELKRISAANAVWVVNEIYSHSLTDRIRHSALVERALYPMMRSFIYESDKPYITEDERKMTEKDIALVRGSLSRIEVERYFNAIVTRIVPDKWQLANQLDQAMLRAFNPVGRFIGGRILLAGRC